MPPQDASGFSAVSNGWRPAPRPFLEVELERVKGVVRRTLPSEDHAMTASEGPPPSSRGRYLSDVTTADLVGPDDVGLVLDVLDAPGGERIGRASQAGWNLDRLGRREAMWWLSIGETPLMSLFFLRSGEFVRDGESPGQETT
jgi:hypothetical protein